MATRKASAKQTGPAAGPQAPDREFTALVGHRAVLQRSLARIKAGTLPPVLILAGTGGVGKGLLASTLAAGLFCDTGQGCGVCPGCQKVIADDHPELLAFYNRQGEDPVRLANDDAKAIQEFIALRPSQIGQSPALQERLKGAGHTLAKVVIVEDFDRFNTVAQNRLLKTLEEPPSYLHFILTTSEPEAILATIRSRSQLERVNGLSADETAMLLTQLKSAESSEQGGGDDFAVLEQLLSRHPLPLGYALRLVKEYGSDFIGFLEDLSRGIAEGPRMAGSDRVALIKRVKDCKIPVLVLLQFFELELNLGYRKQLATARGRLASAQVGRLLYRRNALAAIKAKVVPTTNGQLVVETLLFGR